MSLFHPQIGQILSRAPKKAKKKHFVAILPGNCFVYLKLLLGSFLVSGRFLGATGH